MAIYTEDRVGRVATHFVDNAAERMRDDAVSAVECLECGSALGIRRHLVSLRNRAERCARIERNILHRSSHAARLRRAADEALHALDSGSPAKLARALARVRSLAA